MSNTHSIQLHTLLNLLEDEFREHAQVRVRPSFPAKPVRSIDLEQDYDPNSGTLHLESGVTLQTARKSYYFPVEWMQAGQRHLLLKEIDRIREELSE